MWANPDVRTRAAERYQALSSRGCEFLGSQHAVMGGAMSWVSERNLVAAISNAGGFGVIATGSMAPDALRAEIDGVLERTDKPFGVNVIVLHPELEALIGCCLERSVSHIVLAGGLPPRSMIDRIKSAGAKVLAFAPTLPVARKLVRQGIDALIIEGMEAGGHIGPVSTNVLAQEVLPHLHDIPVFVGGGIGRGDAIALYLAMGASGCQIGTRFVCAHESIAHAKFKQAFIRANARDAQTSVQVDPEFPVIPVRALANGATKKFVDFQKETIERYRQGELDQKAAQLAIEHFWAGALHRAAIDGDVETGSLMAGQSVGMVTAEQSTQEIIDELVEQAIEGMVEPAFPGWYHAGEDDAAQSPPGTAKSPAH